MAGVTIKDKGLAALLSRLDKAAREKVLTVGIHEEAGAAPHGDLSLIDIASMHEFGLGQAQRSFIGAWAEANEAEHKQNLRALGNALVKGTVADPQQGLEQLGELYVGEVQARIAGGIAPPNSPSTIRRKGSSTPLVDNGVLRSSITKQVV
jgi:hypothetical protein